MKKSFRRLISICAGVFLLAGTGFALAKSVNDKVIPVEATEKS